MKQGQDEFFAVIGEGAALLMSLDEQSSGFFDGLNRLREILAILGYSSAVKPLAVSLSDPAASGAALRDYLETGFKLLPPELAAFELVSVRAMAASIGDKALEAQVLDMIAASGDAWKQASTRLAAFDHYGARAVDHGIPKHVLDACFAEANALMKERASDTLEYKEAHSAYEAAGSPESFEPVHAADAATAVAAEAYSQAREQGKGEEEVQEARAAWKAAMAAADAARDERYRKQSEAWERVRAVGQKFNVERAEKVRELLDVKGASIIAKVLEASPITQEQADAWAAAQIIDDGARKRLKKDGYDPAQVVRDMAEFYRLSGGKASAIRIGTDGGRRANANGIFTSRGEKTINIGSGFDKGTLFHELAHHLENDPIANAAANGFLLKRREGEKLHSLRSLTKNSGYRSDEKAWKDGFMNPYIGKYYADGATEVFSMGVQYLANPRDAMKLATHDPEMFALITGYVSTPATPAHAARLSMHKGLLDDAVQKQKDEIAMFDRAIEVLAARAPLEQDGWPESLDKDGNYYKNLFAYTLGGGKPQYMGGNGALKVFTGKVRNPNTKRNVKGFVVVDSYMGDREGTHLSNIPKAMGAATLAMAQAIIALVNRDGTSMSEVRPYFSTRKKLIETVGMENLK